MSKQGHTLALLLLAILVGCAKEDMEHRENPGLNDLNVALSYLNIDPYPPSFKTVFFPGHLRRAGLNPHPTSDTRAQLGRVLFYDTNLSQDRTVSCASCHHQSLAFADNQAFSTGVFKRKTARNSMALGAVASYSAYHSVALNGPGASGFFWDERSDDVVGQARATLLNAHEMDIEMTEVVARVEQLPYYKWLFEGAYNDTEVTESRVLEAISEFVNALGSYRSRFDLAAGNLMPTQLEMPLPALTNVENRGWGLYLGFCSGCHGVELGKPKVPRANNGLEMNYSDQGLGALTGNPAENGVFKVPGLRNIALTGPYMHDGRFNTLGEVVDFYFSGVKPHSNLHPEMKKQVSVSGVPIVVGGTGGGWGGGTTTIGSTLTGSLAGKPNLSAQDKAALLAFLQTLTDINFVNDQRFSNPFR
jgi:cytochrome c peroxidase